MSTLTESRPRRALWAVVGLLGAFLVGAVLAGVVAVAQIRETQLEGTPTGKRLLESSDRILDCTDAGDKDTPAGACYTRNQKRSAELLRQVLGDNIVVAVCATAVPTGLPLEQAIKQVTECVLAQRQTPATP